METKVIAIANHKGGVGKTAVTAGLGAALAAKGKKVLSVDMDPQANLTGAFGRGGITRTLYESMRDGIPLPRLDVAHGLYGSIDIVPSSFGMSGIEREMATSIGHEFILQDLLEPVRAKYDYILIDCPTMLGLIVTNAFVAADYVLVPVTAESHAFTSVDTIARISGAVKKRLNRSLKTLGLVINRWELSNMSETVEDTLRDSYNRLVFETKIRKNVAIAEAVMLGKSIIEYAPQSNGAKDFISLCDEIMTRIGDREG